ncbi:hypothetical protein RB614_31755 [Phytohabitans sp. ZYX-F-186]|uniref:Uncharacterized protein n=1 Tax=Phytohabitans maris TaxID=3071409 RepID=A0ABU0ZPY8_9ACTN|nr:hypothetical protein [Phytohabitans sp. ZYX-F-186]MDQ7909108.1 hypothetical protein [Phytohabitans sp. ZYX-F-186]
MSIWQHVGLAPVRARIRVVRNLAVIADPLSSHQALDPHGADDDLTKDEWSPRDVNRTTGGSYMVARLVNRCPTIHPDRLPSLRATADVPNASARWPSLNRCAGAWEQP